jgi:hypothetical protein
VEWKAQKVSFSLFILQRSPLFRFYSPLPVSYEFRASNPSIPFLSSSIFYETPDFFVDALSPEAQAERSKVKEIVEQRKKGELTEEKVSNHVKIIRNQAAVSLDVDTQLVTLANGQKVYFEKVCLLEFFPFPNLVLILASFCFLLSFHLCFCLSSFSWRLEEPPDSFLSLRSSPMRPSSLSAPSVLYETTSLFFSSIFPIDSLNHLFFPFFSLKKQKLSDFRQLEQVTAEGNKHIAVIGGGFLGSELACALAHRGLSPFLLSFLISPCSLSFLFFFSIGIQIKTVQEKKKKMATN